MSYLVEVDLSQFEWNSRHSPTETRLTDRYRSTYSLSFVTPANFPRAVTVRRMANDVTYTMYAVLPINLCVQPMRTLTLKTTPSNRTHTTHTEDHPLKQDTHSLTLKTTHSNRTHTTHTEDHPLKQDTHSLTPPQTGHTQLTHRHKHTQLTLKTTPLKHTLHTNTSTHSNFASQNVSHTTHTEDDLLKEE